MNTRNLIALTLVLLAGCAAWKPKPVAPPVAPVAVSAAGLLTQVRARGDAVRRLDAVIEAELEGAPGGGRLFGSLQIDDAGAEGQALRLQAYTITGMPVMEVVARGPRFELFSPLEQRTYLNFVGAPGTDAADDFPLALFNETTLPVGLLLEQFGLFWGRGFRPAEFASTPDGYILYERVEGALVRQTEWTRELRLTRVKLFSEGNLFGGMECAEYKGPGEILPAKIELFQGELRLKLSLSRVRTNGQVSGPAIDFRAPGAGRVILLSPPLGPPDQPIVAPEPKAEDAEPAAGSTAAPAPVDGAAVGATISPSVVEGSTAAPAAEGTAVPAPAEGNTAAPPAEPSPGAPTPIVPD